ncbi:hypothetical protein NUW58_g7170 [Xylaria curta]|uniref:Uncharacterized protein n=1 Tax=Xylaria curta TaxID=42375 RepID=A0ACC1NMI3_9PEZI|nr:hypothetical protein NUW58_g7170 [Xylaria curta]
MFDVIWTDPNVELVGQRMQRKEQEAKEKDKKRAGGCRQSVSTTSSSSSERGFTLFAAKSKWKGSTPSRGKTKSNVPTQEGLGSDQGKANRNSTYGVKAALTNQDESESCPQPSHEHFLPVQHPKLEEAGPSSPRDSVFSKWAHQSVVGSGALDKTGANDPAPESKTETWVQTFGPSSFITQTIETVFSPCTEADSDQVLIETHISSDAVKTQTQVLAEVPENAAPGPCEEHESFPPPFICPQTPPPSEYQRHQVSSTQGYHSLDRLANPDAWKPPHEWDCTPTKPAAATTIGERLQLSPASLEANIANFPAFMALQRERRMMAAASPELMIANLTSTLHQQGGYAHLMDQSNEGSESPTTPTRNRILALYETATSASFLATLYPAVPITHLSPNPLSPNLFPNVQPLLVPSVSVSAGSRALPPRIYSAVTCLSMPALFPSTDIPPFLRYINRCLAPGGALHLTIIDPQPVSASMGPKLRQWLFTNLLINLEQAFRTTWPSKTFPAWLALGNLRGKGSTIATITAPAIYESLDHMDAKTKLRCVASRLLWQEVWGKFVNASRWWWEEEEILQECVELGTYWQYSHIIAVKGDRN